MVRRDLRVPGPLTANDPGVTARHPSLELSLTPEPGRWTALMTEPGSDRDSRATREALGLPVDRPIVMAGHQPGFWHMGILAKWYAAIACAEAAGGCAAWVVPDQSPGAEIAYPAERDGRLARAVLRLAGETLPPASAPPTRLTPPTDGATDDVRTGLAEIARRLENHSDAPSLAIQLHRAAAEAIGGETPASFFASDLHTTAAFVELVTAMRDDPAACARLYNEASANHASASVRALEIGPDSVELPLWERTPTGPWRRVTSERLASIDNANLVLRGLPMTGLLRRWACDLFIHGTGGGSSQSDAGYDRVTEDWFRSWLKTDDLAPSVVATATARLDLGDRDLPTPEAIAEAAAAAHRAEHDPSLLGASDLGERKRELAQRIAALPRGSEERSALFEQMQSLRTEAGADHAGELARLRERATGLRERADEAAIAADRTWPFVFHPASRREALRQRINQSIGG